MGEMKTESQRAATKAHITKDGTKKETAMNKVVKIGVPTTTDGNPMKGQLKNDRIKATDTDQASTSQAPEGPHKEAKAMIHGKAGKAGHHPETAGHRMTEADHLH